MTTVESYAESCTNQIKLIREEISVLNKIELARRFNCYRSTINKYIHDSSNELNSENQGK